LIGYFRYGTNFSYLKMSYTMQLNTLINLSIQTQLKKLNIKNWVYALCLWRLSSKWVSIQAFIVFLNQWVIL